MLDINLFREEKGGNPETIRESQRRRFSNVELVNEVIEFDKQWRKKYALINKYNQYVNKIGKLNTAIYLKMKKTKDKSLLGKPDDELPAEISERIVEVCEMTIDDPENPLVTLKATQLKKLKILIEKELIPNEKKLMIDLETKRDKCNFKIGNIVSEKSVVSKNEDNNGLVRKWGGELVSKKYNHVDLLNMVRGMDTLKGSLIAGKRGYFMMGDIVSLNYAIISYGIEFLKKRGYTPIVPPYFMNKEMMSYVAQLEQFDEELYKVTGEMEVDEKSGKIVGESPPKYLIATSEQPICAYHYKTRYTAKELPIKWCGMSTNFRKEVGSHGKDTRGIFRVHQFDKIEQFCTTSPKNGESWKMFDEMIRTAEEFYQSLKLPYRIVNIVSGKLNNAAALKYDLEGWFPASQKYRELVSCSNCTDYQSRRLDARYGQTGGGEKEFVHMLNATLVAATRGICCIAENYQTEKGIEIPEVLIPYMGGQKIIEFKMDKPPQEKKITEKKGKKKKKKNKQ